MIIKWVFDENGKCYIFSLLLFSLLCSLLLFHHHSINWLKIFSCVSQPKKDKKTQDVSFSTPDMLFTTYRYLNR